MFGIEMVFCEVMAAEFSVGESGGRSYGDIMVQVGRLRL